MRKKIDFSNLKYTDGPGRFKIKADTLTKRDVLVLFIGVVAILIILLAIENHYQPPRSIELDPTAKCLSSNDSYSQFRGPCKTLNFSTSNTYTAYIHPGDIRDYWLTIDLTPIPIHNKIRADGMRHYEIRFDTTIYRMTSNWTHSTEHPQRIQNNTQHLNCNIETKRFPNGQVYSSVICDTIRIFHITELDDYNHKIEIVFYESSILKNDFIGFTFKTEILNESYTAFMIVLRYGLVIASLLATVFFAYKLSTRKFATSHELIFEQKYLFLLGILLIISNDPLCIINLNDPIFISPLITSIELGLYYAALCLFFLVMFERVYTEEYLPSTNSLTMTKVTISGFLGSSLTFTLTFFSYKYIYDPGYSISLDSLLTGSTLLLLPLLLSLLLVLSLLLRGLIWQTRSQWACCTSSSCTCTRHKIFQLISVPYVPLSLCLALLSWPSLLLCNWVYWATAAWLYLPVFDDSLWGNEAQSKDKQKHKHKLSLNGSQPLPDLSVSFAGQRRAVMEDSSVLEEEAQEEQEEEEI